MGLQIVRLGNSIKLATPDALPALSLDLMFTTGKCNPEVVSKAATSL